MTKRKDVVASIFVVMCLAATSFLIQPTISQSGRKNSVRAAGFNAGQATASYSANAMWIEPLLSARGAGFRFNITVWLNLTDNVFSYQIALHYNRTQLMCTHAGFTAGATSEYFQGHEGVHQALLIDASFLGNGSILATETCINNDTVNGPRCASLLWAEFEVIIMEASTLDITTETPNYNWVQGLANGESYLIPFTTHNGFVFIDTTPPKINSISWTPTNPYPYEPSSEARTNEPVLVTANVTDDASGLAKVLLSYRTDGREWWNTSMTYNSTATLWTLTIPGQSNDTSTVEFLIQAFDTAGNLNASPTYGYQITHLLLGDVNGDGVVDGSDIALVARHFGEPHP